MELREDLQDHFYYYKGRPSTLNDIQLLISESDYSGRTCIEAVEENSIRVAAATINNTD